MNKPVDTRLATAPSENSPWLQVLPVKPGWHLHLLGPTHSPCLQLGWHTAVQKGFREEKKDQCSVPPENFVPDNVGKRTQSFCFKTSKTTQTLNGLFTPQFFYNDAAPWLNDIWNVLVLLLFLWRKFTNRNGEIIFSQTQCTHQPLLLWMILEK